MSWRIGAFVILLVSLSGCSTYSSMFSDDAPKQAQVVERDTPASRGCARIASQRADDAAMALYVSAGSAEQQEIYQSTYRACLSWQGR